MSFYNTYRPQVFGELDNERVRKIVTTFLSKPKEDLPHAYLFIGPRGVGKTTTARIIAKLFNCENPKKNGEPCGSCHMCQNIAQGRAFDVLEMDAASNTGVDNIRDLKDKILLAPSQAKWKIYIIDEVHMLSTGAFNALLKTLEEPPEHTVFIMATTEPQKVPETIQSRCMVIQFQRPLITEITTALTRIIEHEHLTATADALEILAEAADGSFRDGVKLLEQVSLEGKNITSDTVTRVISLPKDHSIDDILQALTLKKPEQAVRIIQSLVSEGADVRTFYITLMKVLQKNLVALVIGEKTQTALSQKDLRRLLTILHEGYISLRGSSMPDLALELAALEYCDTSGIPSVSDDKPMPAPGNNSPQQSLKPPPPQPQQSPAAGKNSSTPTTIITPAADKEENSAQLSLAALVDHWNDLIEELKPMNHSIAGVLRSARPKEIAHGIVTLETSYSFHRDKLSETKTKTALEDALKKLFGEKVKVEVVLGKK